MVFVLFTVIYASVELSPLCGVGLWPKTWLPVSLFPSHDRMARYFTGFRHVFFTSDGCWDP